MYNMKFLEFGNSENKKIMLIHGFQVPWQVWKPQIDYFSQKYYVIVPILDGHNPTEKSTFSSVHKEAEAIEKYYMRTLRGSNICSLWNVNGWLNRFRFMGE